MTRQAFRLLEKQIIGFISITVVVRSAFLLLG